MKRLWAPWRIGYLKKARSPQKGCLFCRMGKDGSDARQRILTRGRRGFSVLNRFPYNNGHLLIVPYRHVARLESLTQEEWADFRDLIRDSLYRLERVLRPSGYNLGINLGRSGGAGVPGHLHWHIVPRWEGDTNFMPVVAQTRVISQSLDAALRLLKGVRPNS